MAWIERKEGKLMWRVGWRTGGRGTLPDHTPWSTELGDVEDTKRLIEEREEAKKEVAGRLILPWSEVRSKWLATISGRYQKESRATLELHTENWTTTTNATPEAMSKLPITAFRVVRTCVQWAWLVHNQPMDPRAMKVEPVRRRAKKAKPSLTTDERVIECIDRAAKWSAGNGAICHLIALYSTRAQSLVGLGGEAFDGEGLKYKNKNNEMDRQILADWTIAIINALKPKPGKPLFLNHLGEPWESGQQFSWWFRAQIGDGVGYKNLLRCSSMTRLLELAGGNAKKASVVSKHKTPSLIPNTYSHHAEDDERELIGKVADRLKTYSGPRLVGED